MSVFKKSMMAVIAMTVAVSAANANEDFKPYIGLDLAGHKLDDGFNRVEVATLGGRVGVDIQENFGVEGRFGFGIVGEKETATVRQVEVNHYLAAFGKVQTNSYNGFRAYGLAGVAYSELELSQTGFSNQTEDDTSFAWGVGASYAFNNNWGANLEYISLNKDLEAQGLNLGITYHF